MEGDRGLAVLRDPDQWARCHHRGTGLVGTGVELAWEREDHSPVDGCVREPRWSGLAFDRRCQAYLSRTPLGRVDVAATSRSGAHAPGDAGTGPFDRPGALAVDDAERLYILVSGGRQVLVLDLWARRQLRRTSITDPAGRPARGVDLAARACGALVLTAEPPGLVELAGRRWRNGPVLRRPSGAQGLRPQRLAAHGDTVAVLWAAPLRAGAVVARPDGTVLVGTDAAGARDLEFDGAGRLVTSHGPFPTLRRWGQLGRAWVEELPAACPGFDGGALARTPDGRIAYTSTAGVSFVGGDDVRYARSGRVVSYRLDAGSYRARWGRMFVEACLPRGTHLTARFLTSDEDEVPDPLPAAPPARGERPVRAPEATPPMPSVAGLAHVQGPEGRALTLHRAEDRHADPARGGRARYEVPVIADPGRYLWVVLDLAGTGRATPRVEAISVERPGHRLLEALPRSWSRNPEEADFVQRFLAPAEGLLHGLDELASRRHTLLDPAVVPERTLDWLASLVGLVLDGRWPVPVQREFLASAYDLYRVRGTVAGLERALSIYLQRPVPVVERWRLAGLGGVVLAGDDTGPSTELPPRIAAAESGSAALDGFTIGADTEGHGTAHRFTVLVPLALDDEQRDAVLALVERFKPAHTSFDVCELGAGMRLGASLYLGLTSVVGTASAWGPLVVGDTPVGVDAVLDLPGIGAQVGAAVLGRPELDEGVRVG